MALTKYSLRRPTLTAWPELDSNRLSRVFDDAFFAPMRPAGWTPAVTVTESADELRLTAELPGMREEDIAIDLENNVLTLSGEKSEVRDEEDEGRRYHVVERRYGSFKRAFTLPRAVDADNIVATFENGLLNVTIPKAPEAKGRKIAITK